MSDCLFFWNLNLEVNYHIQEFSKPDQIIY
jgi:hypothetical protein